jgi:hypothetical protein
MSFIVTVVMAIHQREAITIETINRLKKQKNINKIITVGDSATERIIAKKTKSIYVETTNLPLGAKWQTGVNLARSYKNDGIMICGSDGWLTANWIETTASYLDNFDLIGKNNAYIFNIDTNELLKIKYTESRTKYPMGSGRIISRRILDKMNWKLFPVKRNSSLDTQSTKKIIANEGKIFIYNGDEINIFGLKGNYDTVTEFKKIKESKNLDKTNIPNPLNYINKKYPDIMMSFTTVKKQMKKK